MELYDNYLSIEPTPLGARVQKLRAQAEWEIIWPEASDKGVFLEIGPGHGVMAQVVKAAGQSYLGIEANMHISRTMRSSGFQVSRAFVPPMPIRSQSISVVYAAHVIEHLPGPDIALLFAQEANRVLGDGGLLFISAPDMRSFGTNFWDADYTHRFPTTRRRMQQLLYDAGFEIISTVYFSGPIKGPVSGILSALARIMPSELFIIPDAIGERLTRLRLTFMRNIAVLARKQ